jgi:hypothetical protein
MGKRKDEGHVHVDPLGDEGLNGGDAFRRGGDLDHRVGPAEDLEKHPGLGDGSLRVVGKLRVCLEAHIAVGAPRGVPDGTEEVGRPPDVVEGQREVDFVVRFSLINEFPKGLVVVRAARDGLLEDGGVGGDAGDAAGDEGLQLAGVDQRAADKIQPDGLAEPVEILDCAHDGPPRADRRKGR